MTGWIKLHRKLTQTSFYKNSQTVHLAIHLLLKANHSDMKIIFNNEEVSIKRGSLITGRHALSRETGIHESTIYRKLKVLEKVGFSHIKSNNKYSMITIYNYDAYNCINYQGKQHIEQPANNQRTQTRMNKNDKNIYMCHFNEFWKVYPSRHGKKLGKGKSLETFMKIRSEELENVVRAAKNYAESKDVQNGIGIRDPKRFLKNDYWKEWIDAGRTKRFDEIGH